MKLFWIACISLLFFPVMADFPRRALLIMYDGARADMSLSLKLKNFERLRSGKWALGYRTAYSNTTQCIADAPSISGPNHASIATGVTAAKHKVIAKGDIIKGNFAKWPLAISRIKQQNEKLRIGFYHNWKEDGNFPLAPGILRFKGNDHQNAQLVADKLKNNQLDVVQIFFGLMDGAGHTAGFYPYSKRYREQAQEADRLLGILLDALIERSEFQNEDWLVIVCSDHGGWGQQHSSGNSHCRTTELLISGRNVTPGEIAGVPTTADIGVTLLNHFSIFIPELDGQVRGNKTWTPEPGKEKTLPFSLASFKDQNKVWVIASAGKTELTINAQKENSSFIKVTAVFYKNGKKQVELGPYLTSVTEPGNWELSFHNNSMTLTQFMSDGTFYRTSAPCLFPQELLAATWIIK